VVGAAYTEVKTGILQQRATEVKAKKVMQRTDKVSVLGKTEAQRVAASTLQQFKQSLRRAL